MRRCRDLPRLAGATILAASLLLAGSSIRADNWPRFRGQNGSGISEEEGFSAPGNPDRVRWTIPVPGTGHSSPVIWGTKLFLTTASETGTTRSALCFDAETGKLLWTRSIQLNANPKHHKSSWASATPAVDSDRVIVAFADVQRFLLLAYDFDGKPLWEKNLGGFESQHGEGASPILYEDLVIMVNDQDGPSSIVALDKRTGHAVWTVPRKSGSQSTSYATPFIYRPKQGPPQLICSSSFSGVSALDPKTGKTIWTTKSLPQRTVGSPVLSTGLILQCCGAGGQGSLMVAVGPTGQGDVSQTEIRYKRTKVLPYVPTPLAYQNYVFLWGDRGTVCCINPTTGRDVWTKRVGGDFSGSPIGAGGMLFNIDEHGDTIVLAAGPEFKLLGKIPLGEPSHSTPAVANGRPLLADASPSDVRRRPAVTSRSETGRGPAPSPGLPSAASGRLCLRFLIFQADLPPPPGQVLL
jgi:outer membrane protein assembly factor BamB